MCITAVHSFTKWYSSLEHDVMLSKLVLPSISSSSYHSSSMSSAPSQCTLSPLTTSWRVPERVTYLREILDSDPSRLKEVFLESLKLESLRFGLVDEIQLSKDRRSSVAGAGAVHVPPFVIIWWYQRMKLYRSVQHRIVVFKSSSCKTSVNSDYKVVNKIIKWHLIFEIASN